MTIGMDGEPKKEKDYKEILDAKLPEIEKNAKGNLTGALDALMVLEKQTRVAADQASNSRVLILILQLCYNEKNLKLLNDNIILLSKKHGFLKACVTKMVQHAMTFLDGITDQKNKLEMIDTLRTVTEGKIFVEVERARVTRILSKIKEDQGNIAEACDILHDLQVETFGSMEKREKTDFILEQMRLCLAKMDFTKVVIISKKINLKYFKDVENHDLKLRYCELMIKLYLKEEKYFEICKLYYQVYDTPSIKADEAKLVDTVQNIVLFVVLSSYNNEQSDFIHRTYEDPNLSKLPLYKEFLKCFITNELVRWPKIDEIYGNVIKQTFVFKSVGAAGNDGEKRWKELHKRVIEHNIRVIAKYYKRISVKRITQLLDLDSDEAEKFLSNLVVAKTIYARIDRPAGIITFQAKQDANALLNEWSGKVEGILGLIAKTTHLITKEEMVQEIVKN